ncbi:uncharacterized protein MELLADRAFT_73507 [Melampsora larici-populina 98AG31]|uniref:Uncharacterized protein n=1 Tax=Melampsora larici-populina (strain 98AG31 / pathotype 3-4-7) TaxID=747676 RepID=F4S955_MELLP|nr:uncharacterized protein MELLADRAFT_73507 [Melampsora larici-populina 98AG31]EGF98823.1 hypothetical protein MELLADRAFT_73507 [Melampsora larici-populina 98AG31]
MTSYIAKKVGHSFLASHVAGLEPRDPQYEITTDPNTGQQTRKKRDVPPGLSKKEEKILRKVRKRAHRLDKGFSLCGFRFGWTAIIGLIPVLGDVVDASLSYFLVIRPARKCDLPMLLVERMLLNQAVSTSIGLVPFAGDILMAVWKVNSRNAALLEDFLIARGKANLEEQANGTASHPVAKVSKKQTSKLVENSKKSGYIDGKTGAKASDLNGNDDVQTGLVDQTGPSTSTSASTTGVKKVSPTGELNSSSKDQSPSRSRWWFSKKKETKLSTD